MGEKDIVPDDGHGTTTSGGGLVGGGPTTTGGGTTDDGPGGGGPGTTPGGSDTPKTQEKKDPCKELTEKAQELLKQLEGVHEQNRDAMQRALRAFYGDPKKSTYDGYAHWFSQAKITEAVVDASNATGKALIDVALFAAGGWGGIFGEASLAGKAFGTGLSGAKNVGDAYGKIALKVLEKAGDEMFGHKAGKAGVTAAKTIDKWDDPKKWFQAPLSGLESVIRGSLIDALGGWMKAGATSADLGRAQASYADFYAAAMIANTTAAAGEQLRQQLQDVNAQLRAAGCPEVPIPDYVFYTFELTQFGDGAFKGEKGPSMKSHAIESGTDRSWDLFANVNSQSSLPF